MKTLLTCFNFIKRIITMPLSGFDKASTNTYIGIWILTEVVFMLHNKRVHAYIGKYFDMEFSIIQFSATLLFFMFGCAVHFTKQNNQASIEEINKAKQDTLSIFNELYKVPLFFGSMLFIGGVSGAMVSIFWAVADVNQSIFPHIKTGAINMAFGVFNMTLAYMLNGFIKRQDQNEIFTK